MTAFPKQKRPRNRGFLAWAKGQRGVCCICRDADGSELHHWGESGMGLKGSDYRVARVCWECHEEMQGKGRIAVEREECYGTWEAWADMLEDTVTLLEGYSERGE